MNTHSNRRRFAASGPRVFIRLARRALRTRFMRPTDQIDAGDRCARPTTHCRLFGAVNRDGGGCRHSPRLQIFPSAYTYDRASALKFHPAPPAVLFCALFPSGSADRPTATHPSSRARSTGNRPIIIIRVHAITYAWALYADVAFFTTIFTPYGVVLKRVHPMFDRATHVNSRFFSMQNSNEQYYWIFVEKK